MLKISSNLPSRSQSPPPSAPQSPPQPSPDHIRNPQPAEPLSTLHIPVHFPTSHEFAQADANFHTSPHQSIATALSLVQSKAVNALAMKNLTNTEAMSEMRHFLHRIDIDDDVLNSMNFVHLAGSKGKGSTSAYTESILHRSGYKTGLFTSPHLVNVTERFRIDTETVSNDDFAKYFWQVWDKLITTIPDHFQTTQKDGLPSKPTPPSPQPTHRFSPLPPYFTLLTLVSLHMFKEKNVDVVVFEVGLGGKLDATNIISNPLVTAITTLSMEHAEILGDTLGKIAHEKCGIFKNNTEIVVFPQKDEAWDVILREAHKVNQTPILINTEELRDDVELGIEGDYQKKNANMAMILSLIAMNKLREKGIKGTYVDKPKSEKVKRPEGNPPVAASSITSPLHHSLDHHVDTRSIAKLKSFDELEHFSTNLLAKQQHALKLHLESTNEGEQQLKEIRIQRRVDLIDTFFNHELDPEYIRTMFDSNISREFDPEAGELDEINTHHLPKLQQSIQNLKETQTHLDHPMRRPPLAFVSTDEWVAKLTVELKSYIAGAKHYLKYQQHISIQTTPPIPLNPSHRALSSTTPHPTLDYPMFHIHTFTPQVLLGLCWTRLRGRCDRFVSRQLSGLKWYIDGAHTPESVASATHWYHDQLHKHHANEEEREMTTDQPSKSSLIEPNPLNRINQAHQSHQPKINRLAPLFPFTDLLPLPTTTTNSDQFPHSNLFKNHPTSIHQAHLDSTPTNNTQTHKEGPQSSLSLDGPFHLEDQPPEQRILMFNCGHVRSPFVLMSPMIDELYSPLEQTTSSPTTAIVPDSAFYEHPGEIDIKPIKPPKFYKPAAHKRLLKPNLTQSNDDNFDHVFFCPFDQDKPHPLPFPPLISLFSSHDHNAVPTVDIHNITPQLPNQPQSHTPQFSPHNMFLNDFQSFLESHTYSTFKLNSNNQQQQQQHQQQQQQQQQQHEPNKNTSDKKHNTDDNDKNDDLYFFSQFTPPEQIHSLKPQTSDVQAVKWQLTNMVIWDFLTSSKLTQPTTTDSDQIHPIPFPNNITSTSTLSLLNSTHEFTHTFPTTSPSSPPNQADSHPNTLQSTQSHSNPPLTFYSHHTYANFPFEFQPNLPPQFLHSKPPLPTPSHYFHPTILPFHPPIATITRHFHSPTNTLLNPSSATAPIKSFQFHVMPSARDAILAIKHLHQQQPSASFNHQPIKSPQPPTHSQKRNHPMPQHNKNKETTNRDEKSSKKRDPCKPHRKSKVFVTGSLYLVGNTLKHLKAKV